MHKFDSIVSGAFDIAQSIAIERRHLQLEPVHLLYGFMQNPKSTSAKSLKPFAKRLESVMKSLAVVESKNYQLDQLKPSSALANWVTMASSSAIQERRDEVTEADFLTHLLKFFPDLQGIDIHAAAANDELEKPSFLVDLNELAREGKLDPVIGRTREIRAAMEILGRRRKNNPILVGDAGVGKTAVVEGLAELIEKGKVPEALKDKTIFSLDIGALMAGTKFRGEFEERLQDLIAFVKAKAGKAILFIDEIHQLVGAGKTEGAMDAANLLKPALARGELHCIGATTYAEYRQYILKDAALERRFRAIPINEPSEEDAIEIMMGLKEKFEIHHGIEITDDAIFSSVFLSKQYIPDKQLPDKAIDLVDEAASALKLSAEAMPPNLVELEAEIRAKMIYAKTEKSSQDSEEQLAHLQKKFATEKAVWEQDVLGLKRLTEIKSSLDRARFDLEKSVQNGDYENASKLKFAVIPDLQKQLEQSSGTWRLEKKDIAQVISRQTGIPVDKILRSKQQNILGLEAELKKRVFGQNESLAEIAETLIAAYAGLSDINRPLGSFLLLGPTGVGKTETAKTLAHYLFENEDSIIRMDMSEYSEKHSCAKLIGSPAGYVGYEDGGILTEALRRKPYSVVLFDEVEKAHPDFADILLQMLDDGRLTDNKGRTVSCKNAILILTSNSKDIKKDFKPELIGRLDAVLTYKPITKDIMHELVMKQLRLANDRLRSKNLELSLSDNLVRELSSRGLDQVYGARPLKTLFSKIVLRPLSHQILSGDIPSGKISADVNEAGAISFSPLA